MDVTELPNLGPHSRIELERVGIRTADDLMEAGAEKAWLKMRVNDPGVCLHQLYALEGAIRGIPKRYLPEDRKAELREFFNSEQ